MEDQASGEMDVNDATTTILRKKKHVILPLLNSFHPGLYRDAKLISVGQNKVTGLNLLQESDTNKTLILILRKCLNIRYTPYTNMLIPVIHFHLCIFDT